MVNHRHRLITDNDETVYREEVRDLAGWCQNNNLSLNITKTKEMIVDYILIDGAVVEQVESLVSTSTTNYNGPNTPR